MFTFSLHHNKIQVQEPVQGSVSINGEATPLTRLQATILATLAKRKGKICTKNMFLDALYAPGTVRPRSSLNLVSVCVHWLRKIEELEIVTVRGRGYRIGDPPSPLVSNALPKGLRVNRNWSSSKKEAILGLLFYRQITKTELLNHFSDLTNEELLEWEEKFALFGKSGLCARHL